MAFSIQDFRAQMQYDGARPNLFECTMTFPTAVIANSNAVQEKFTFFARSAQIPGSQVNAIPVNYFGREVKFAGNRIFTEWTVTIINDEDFKVRNALEVWMNGLNSHRFNLRNPNMVNSFDYQQDGYVKQYSKTGDVLKAYKFIGLFPTDLSPIEVDWASNDMIEEYAVTFAYQWWETISGDQASLVNESVY
jgi:hypothetical protein